MLVSYSLFTFLLLQLMVVGQNGVTGNPAPYLVEVETKAEPVYVKNLNLNIEEMIVRMMEHQLQKPEDVMKSLAHVRQTLGLYKLNNHLSA